METQSSFIDTRIYPSIVRQTKWPCAFFNFGKAQTKEVCYFNPSLVERPDGLWLVTRRAKNERNVRIGYNDLMAFKMGGNGYLEYGVIMKFQKFFQKEHYEDPRAIYHNGITYIGACNFVVMNDGKMWTGAHQVLNVINHMETKSTWVVDRRIDPVYGYNGGRIGADKGAEKNWLWFFHQDELHLEYQASPHIVAKFDLHGRALAEYKTETKFNWDYGVIRGGTPPVLIHNNGGEYLTFFHSRLPTNDYYRARYYMGAYTFESKPPFRILRMTTEPLLAGSRDDIWGKDKPLVVFPCGSRLKDGKWLVTLGINDLASAYIEIPHSDLDKLLLYKCIN
jgi:predicted GH43/DUF377 family glycosyl hydrolase